MSTSDLAEARQWCGECNIVLGEPHRVRQILPDLKRLEWVQSTWIGVGPLLDPAYRRDYRLTHLGDLYGPVMAEYVFCYLLMHARRAWQRYQAQLEGRWDNSVTGVLYGKTIGLMGVGRIGARLAETAKHFGMRTRGLTLSSRGCEFVDAYYSRDQKLEFVSGLDYLVCVLPETPETHHIVDKATLVALPRHAVLVNVGRGGVVDEEALVEALHARTIGGAVLDVFQQEPLPPGHPLWCAPNTIITCHSAAPGPDYPDEIVGILEENYRRFVAGQPLLNLVDFERGY